MGKKIAGYIICCLVTMALLFGSCGTSTPTSGDSTSSDGPNIEETVVPDTESEEPVVEPKVTEPESEGAVIEDESEPEVTEPDESADPEPEVIEKPAPAPLPEEAPVPEHKYQELVDYALELINADRTANGLDPVELRGNTASQTHAEENLAYSYASHWSLNGMKPYMRYTLAGGVNYVGENVIGTGIQTAGTTPGARDIEDLVRQSEEQFMLSSVHRANILDPWHKTVSIGIAYNDNNFHMVQHFEGDYIGFSTVPTLAGGILTMAGKVKGGTFERIVVYYDAPLQTLTTAQLNAPPYDSSYSMGVEAGNILQPLPEDQYYTNLRQTDIVAAMYDSWDGGWFSMTADISNILTKGSGVYTVVILATIDGELVPITNYSLFVN